MADASPSTSSENQTQPRGRGRGRGKSRGGLGKYLRARGRGARSYGRGAEFTKRLVLEGEEVPEEEDPEEAEATRQRYARRQLVSNADQYAEEEPQLDSDGEEIKEPEVDLSTFLEKQRSSDAARPGVLEGNEDEDEDDEIDHALAHITSQRQPVSRSKKGRVQTIEWDASLEQMHREKAAADAHRDLKERFRAKAGTLRTKPMTPKERKKENDIVEAPPLPTGDVTDKDPKREMQDFLDDLLG